MKETNSIDVWIVVVYLVLTVCSSFLFMKRSGSTEGFTAANRSMPWWACGMSIFATYVSSISFLGLPGQAYLNNWNAYVFSLSIPIAVWFGIKFFVPLYRSRGEVSAYSYLEHRFGPWARIYASVCYLLTQLARMGSVTYLMALPVSALLGWDIVTVIIITGVAVTIYSLLGGIEAVIWNDTFQGVLLTIGAIFCLGVIWYQMPGGTSEIVRIASENDKFSLGSFGTSLTQSTFWVVLIYGIFINLQNFGIDQSYIQRFISAKSDREATKATLLGGLLYIPVSALFFLIGTSLFAYYTAQPELLPDTYREAGMSDKVFAFFIVDGLPVGVTGLLIAAIFAAAMSTISTSVNSASTVIMTDFYKRLINPDATDKQCMRVLYGASLTLGMAAIIMALAMIRVESALDAWWKLASVFSGGMLGLFLLGFFSRATRNAEAILGVAAGVVIIMWMSMSGWSAFNWFIPEAARSPFHNYLAIVFGTTAIMLVGFLGTLLMQRVRAARQQET